MFNNDQNNFVVFFFSFESSGRETMYTQNKTKKKHTYLFTNKGGKEHRSRKKNERERTLKNIYDGYCHCSLIIICCMG